MVGAKGSPRSRRVSGNAVGGENWSLKSLVYPQFDSRVNEKKYIWNYLKKIYPLSHRLLVIILVTHALINSIEIFALKPLRSEWSIRHLICLGLSLLFNGFSLLVVGRLRTRLLANLFSLICLTPLTILSCLYPVECHLYLLIILIYTLANLPLLCSLLLSALITIIISIFPLKLDVRLILLLISNLVGIYLNRLLDITMRSAYNQLYANAKVRGSLLSEHTLISKMIDSLMPRKYALDIMEDFDVFRERVQNINVPRPGQDDLQMTVFRPLHIERMENVSILFADIVGFTHMSSNKTASQLVALLSDLYGRFDNLCVQMSCEKIATLGDCYYCVSGCPEPREDHARSCVLMGLAMINAIEEFDQDNQEEVDMRVGVHSGSVNCGIVGTIKFKFDIFSNDVTLANKMESTGKPGFVHITEATHILLLNDEFNFEDGEIYTPPKQQPIKTYFIGKRHLTHRITQKPPAMTLATAAAVAVASGVSLNETNPLPESNSPLLDEVERARRATISVGGVEDEVDKVREDVEQGENINEITIESEEKELVMASQMLTLRYKEKRLEEGFSAHVSPSSLLIVEVLLSLICLLLFYLLLPHRLIPSIVLSILIGIEFLLTLILLCFSSSVDFLLRWWIVRHLFASIYLLSPLILLVSSFSTSSLDMSVFMSFVLFLSTSLTLGASISHLIKSLLGLVAIVIYLPLMILKENELTGKRSMFL